MLTSVRRSRVVRTALVAVFSVFAIVMASLPAAAALLPLPTDSAAVPTRSPKPFVFPTRTRAPLPIPTFTEPQPLPLPTKAAPLPTPTPTMAAKAPSVPSNVVATVVNATVVLTWAAPASGKPDRYIAKSSTGGGECKQAPATDSPTCTVLGLSKGASYTFTVIAENGNYPYRADSPPSAPSNSVTIGGPPGPAVDVKAVSGNQTASISWTAPANDGGSAISGYRVATTGSLNVCNTEPGTTSCTANGLSNGVKYAFVVTTTNGDGLSSASAVSNPVVPSAQPGPPTGVQATGGDSNATVSWTAPQETGGSSIKSYAIQTNLVGGGGIASGVSTKGCDQTATTCVVSGLKNGTSYTFRVSATNTEGQTSAWSAPSDAVESGKLAPDPPQNAVGAPVKGGGAVAVSWTAPASSGSTWLMKYVVTAFLNNVAVSGGSCSTSRGTVDIYSAPGTSCVVKDLANGSAYTFSVVAWNKTLASLPSPASAPVTPSGAPAPPTGVVAVPGNGNATVSWAAAPTSANITGYTVVSTSGKQTCSPPPTPTPVATTCTVTGLPNAVPVSFVVKATNSSGTSTESAPSAAVTPIGPPAPPQNVTAVAAGDTTIVVTWVAPQNNGGSPVQSFTATSFAGQNPANLCFGSQYQVTCPIQNLTKGVPYTVSVIATNAAGFQSQPSAATPAVTPGTSNPSAPQAVTGTAGNAKIDVKWTAPTSAGASRINGYVATASPVSDPMDGAKPTPAGTCSTSSAYVAPGTSCSISSLTNGTPYTITVVANNSAGASDPSAPSADVTPAGAPLAPTDITATAGDGSIAVNWGPPASDGGSAVTGYVATATKSTYPHTKSTCATTSETNCSISGLVNGTAYDIGVEVTNKQGLKASASAPGTTTPFGVPGAPASVSGQPGDKQVTVSWTAPKSDGGSPVTGYTVVASSAAGSCSPVGTGLSCVIDQLTNGKAYTFAVTATNQRGAGAAAVSKDIVPGKIQSDPPTNVHGTPGNAAVQVTWDKPGDTGAGTPYQYVVQAVGDPTKTCTRSVLLSNECTVTGLTNGTQYQFEAKLVTLNKGASDWSTPSTEVSPGGPPGPATITQVTAGNASVAVSWQAPANTGGSGLKAYTVTAASSGVSAAAKKPTCQATAPTANCTVDGLTNGTSYQFVVTTTTNSNQTSTSIPSAPVTPVGPPSPPTSLTAKPGNQAVALNWKKPANTGGSAIDHYTVSSSNGGACTAPPAETSCTVGALDNHTEYTFTVTATNTGPPQETSGVSNAVKATPGKLVPDAPSDLVGAPVNSAVKVSWTPPAVGDIVKTVVTATPGGNTCTALLGAKSCSVDKLTNGNSYTFVAQSTSVLGHVSPPSAPSAPVSPGTIPSAPASVTATAGDGAITVSWTAPADGGSQITGYVATASAGRTAAGSCSVATGTTCEIGSLANGTKYSVSVVAANAFGTSKPGKYSKDVKPEGPPSPPQAVDATAGLGDATVTWTAPASTGGKELQSYTVTSNVVSASRDASAAPAQTCTTNRILLKPPALKCVVPGLTAGTTYTFNVVAQSANGTSQPSAPSNEVQPGATTPGAPLQPTASGDTPQQADVAWKPPASSGSSRITGYQVTANPGGLTCKPLTVTTNPHCTVKKLTDGVAYTFTVTAQNKSGTGPASVPTNSVTPVGAPGAPQEVSGAAGDAQLTAKWTAPASDGGRAITGYVVTVTDWLGVNAGGCAGGPSSTSCLVDGLKNGSKYRVHVAASNGALGPKATDPNWVVLEGPPSPPLGVSAVAGDQLATVKWSVPSSDGGKVVTKYEVTSANANGSPNGSCTTNKGALGIDKSCKVTGLKNGTPYTFTVVATNAAGSSLPSAPSVAVTPGSEKPSPPTNVTAQGYNKSAVVSWQPPTDQGGATVTGYHVTATTGVIKPACSATDGALSCTVTGLTSNTKYQFNVVAINSFGSSKPALSPEVSTVAVPDAPLPLSIGGMAGKKSITAWWGVPTNDGGSPIQSYTATASPGGLSCKGTSSPTGGKKAQAQTFCTIAGLSPGTTYSISVFATNANGNGPAATGPKPITVPGAPGVPTNVVATISNAVVTLRWTAPAYTAGSPVANYAITPNVLLGSATCPNTATTSCTITGLAPGKKGQWAVTAINTKGQVGTTSPFSNVVTNTGGARAATAVLSPGVRRLSATKYRVIVHAAGVGGPPPREAAVRVNDRDRWIPVKLAADGSGRVDIRVRAHRGNIVRVRATGAQPTVITFRSR